jgi:quercetin 2,3-dioxygenase
VQGEFTDTAPFILLMDDMPDKKTNEPVGGPYPHTGFKTISLLPEGEMGEETLKRKVVICAC